MNLRERLKIGKISAVLGNVKKLRPKISHNSLIKSTILVMILFLAFGIRLLPVRWGYYLTEFDPYHQYRQTKYIVDHGLLAWANWHDYMSWYPAGSQISKVSYPGLPTTAAALYLVLNALGIRIVQPESLNPLASDPVYNLCVIFPVIMATLSCFVIYFLGKDLGGEKVGLFAAFFLALDSSYIGRTSLGWFDDETVGILGILLFTLFFIRSIGTNRTLRTGSLYAIAAGLSLGYLCASWGAMRYPIAMTALFVLILVIIRRYSPRLLLSYGITFGIALLIAANVPYLTYRFLFEETVLPVYGVFAILCVAEINRRTKTLNRKLIYIAALLALAAAMFGVLYSMGLVQGLQAKFLSVLNPGTRTALPIVESVAEHRPSAWGTFYYNFGIGIFFIPIGLFFATLIASDLSIYMIVFSLTSVYFASSMIRLNVLVSPALGLLWALAIVRLLRPFALFLKETPTISKRKLQLRGTVGKEVVGVLMILMFVLFSLTYVVGTDFFLGPTGAQGPRVFGQAYAPTTIAAASLPLKPTSTVTDWLDALVWMRNYLPPSSENPSKPGTVVAAWWDYGYWIRVIGNRTTLVDNGTWNSTQVKQVANMFMTDVENATKILKKYNVTHVVVFDTVYSSSDAAGYDASYGEFGKFKWMIRIAGLNETTFGSDQTTSGGGTYWGWSDYGKNTTLYRMIVDGKFRALGATVSKVQTDYFELNWTRFDSRFKLVFPTTGYKNVANGGLYAFVFVYEVKY